jgi:2-hydroxychromene-2-carboxylate isomerase
VDRPLFFYDVGSPWCWLAAEGVGGGPEWVPAALPSEPADDRAAVEAIAAERSLLDVRWPDPFPFDSRAAMLGATFAKQAGRGVAYSLAAMRQAFAAGRDLSETDNVLLAAAACELHPRAVLKGIESRVVAAALDDATQRAADLGVRVLPALAEGGRVVAGSALVERLGAEAAQFGGL